MVIPFARSVPFPHSRRYVSIKACASIAPPFRSDDQSGVSLTIQALDIPKWHPQIVLPSEFQRRPGQADVGDGSLNCSSRVGVDNAAKIFEAKSGSYQIKRLIEYQSSTIARTSNLE
jgi:hypothetical protein